MNNILIKKTILIVTSFFIFIIISKQVISNFSKSLNLENEFIIQAFWKLFLLLLTIYIIKKDKSFNLNYIFKNNILCLLISSLFVYLSISSTLNYMIEKKIIISNFNHYSYLFRCLGTGFFEELFFRYLIFGLICRILKTNNSKNIYKEILLTSFIFGIVHSSNFFNSNYDSFSVINQMLFAFDIGVLLQCIFIRTNNIILISIIHSLVNYNGMRNSVLFKIENHSVSQNIIDDFLQTLITFFILGFIVFILGYLIIRNRKIKLFNT